MYKLILADDEPFIRDGMRDLIDWAELGFEIAGVFEDGNQVISYLENHQADVVVTDIKMPFGTGLDIARYVYDNHLHTRIIFISGYQEIDLAMAAIKYNVCQYILKPIDIEELKNQLVLIRQQLDEERKHRSNQFSLDYYRHSIEALKEDFFIELATGSFSNETYLTNVFHLLYPKMEITASPCCEITLNFENYQDYLKNYWNHTNSELYRCLQNCIQLCSASVEYRMIRKNDNIVELFGLLVGPSQPEQVRNCFKSELNALCRELRETFSIEATCTKLSIYGSILEFSQNCFNSFSADDPTFLLKLHEQEKLLLSSLGSGQKEVTQSVLGHLSTYFKKLDFSVAQELALEMITIFRTKLNEAGSNQSAALLSQKGDLKIRQTKNFAELEQALYQLFDELDDIQSSETNREDDLIRNVKEYIIQHITEDISLESISANFYLSQYYFSRIFKTKTGENLIDYIIAQKMEKAKQLLKNPKHKIYEIGQIIGYQSNQYFTKVFKNHTGYTPSEYRAMILSTQR